jgi:hypothetical protein
VFSANRMQLSWTLELAFEYLDSYLIMEQRLVLPCSTIDSISKISEISHAVGLQIDVEQKFYCYYKNKWCRTYYRKFWDRIIIFLPRSSSCQLFRATIVHWCVALPPMWSPPSNPLEGKSRKLGSSVCLH